MLSRITGTLVNLNFACKQDMKEYNATFKNMRGLAVILILLSLLFVLIGLYGKSLGMVVIGIMFVLLLISIRLRFKVKFDEHSLSSTGFFSTKTLKWSEIRKVIRVLDYGPAKNRFYGPFVYEFQSLHDNLKINFKLFPVECKAEILDRAKEHAE